MLTYAIGDIHGMAKMLKGAFEAIAADAAGRPYRIVALGDYVDRGPSSRGVIDLLRDGPEDKACVDLVRLCGNHDAWFIQAVLGDRMNPSFYRLRAAWLAIGGDEVIKEYRKDEKALRADARWLDENTKLSFLDEKGRIFVHAGLKPGVALDEQSPEDLMWIRKGFLDSQADFGAVVVHGHTITRGRMPEVHDNRVAVDTGAYRSDGFLSVATFEDGDPYPSRFLRAPHTLGRPKFAVLASRPPSGEYSLMRGYG